MDANSIYELLSSISVGSLVAFATVASAIIGALCTGTIKLYKIFIKYKAVHDENENLKNAVKTHEELFIKIQDQLTEMEKNFNAKFSEIKTDLDEQRVTTIKKLRHDITNSGEKALADGHMTVRQWTSLNEMANEYMNQYKQNSYVKSLMEKVNHDVIVNGRLDEHGNDVE